MSLDLNWYAYGVERIVYEDQLPQFQFKESIFGKIYPPFYTYNGRLPLGIKTSQANGAKGIQFDLYLTNNVSASNGYLVRRITRTAEEENSELKLTIAKLREEIAKLKAQIENRYSPTLVTAMPRSDLSSSSLPSSSYLSLPAPDQNANYV